MWTYRGMVVSFVLLAALSGGCAYMTDRGNDALDIFDAGITVTKEPHFAAYVGFQSLLAVGYSNVDGKMIGLGNRKAGWLDTRYYAGGFLFEGYEQYGYEDYDAGNPDSPTQRGIGLGLIYGGYPDKFIGYLNCAKFLHLGFIGVNLNCKIGEVLDFLLGWTTLDIGKDDVHSRPT